MATSANKQAKPAPKISAVPDPEPVQALAPRRKKRGILKMLLPLTLLLGGAGGGAWYFLQDDPAQEESQPAAKASAAKSAPAKPLSNKPPLFVPLEPFTVNLQNEDSSAQFLQVTLVVKVSESGVADAIKLRMPEVRNRVLMLLSAKTASEITTVEGKKKLSSELSREIAQPLTGSIPAQAIDSVLFTSFVVQ